MRKLQRDQAAASRPRGQRPCPLPLWRTREPARIAPGEVVDLAGVLASTAILRERRWPAARAGDPAAAVAVAIDQIRRRGPDGPLADVIMGNLALLALRGEPTSRVVLGLAIRALARLHPERQDLPGLGAAWTGRSPANGGRCA